MACRFGSSAREWIYLLKLKLSEGFGWVDLVAAIS